MIAYIRATVKKKDPERKASMVRKRRKKIVKTSGKNQRAKKEVLPGIEPIDDTPENVARALFGLKRKGKNNSKS
ncbi:MAG: hypothetical protein OXP71_07200 [Candidatus Poribacteria bacterium]|nr:hypothetical protein [Candidatus Poribacteria bacterium]